MEILLINLILKICQLPNILEIPMQLKTMRSYMNMKLSYQHSNKIKYLKTIFNLKTFMKSAVTEIVIKSRNTFLR